MSCSNEYKITTQMNEYYVYVYLNPTIKGNYKYKLQNNESISFNCKPFYVGKGKGNRFSYHYKNCEKSEYNCVKNDYILDMKKNDISPMVQIVKMGLTEKESLNYEKLLIHNIKDLTNIQIPKMYVIGERIGIKVFEVIDGIINKVYSSVKDYLISNCISKYTFYKISEKVSGCYYICK